MKLIIRIIISILINYSIVFVCFSSSFEDAKNFGQSLNQTIDPGNQDVNIIPGYAGTDQDQKKYYYNQDYGNLENDALQEIQNNNAAKLIHDEARKPNIQFSNDDPILKYKRDIDNNLIDSGTDGMINLQFKDCEQSAGTTPTTYTKEHCESYMLPDSKSCNKVLKIEVENNSVSKTQQVLSYNSTIDANLNVRFNVISETGESISSGLFLSQQITQLAATKGIDYLEYNETNHGDKPAYVTISPIDTRQGNIVVDSIKIEGFNWVGAGRSTITIIKTPSGDDDRIIEINWYDAPDGEGSTTITVIVTYHFDEVKIINENWENGCLDLESKVQ